MSNSLATVCGILMAIACMAYEEQHPIARVQLMIGFSLTGDRAMLDCARAAMQWHIDHPGRYEVSHVMGPLTVARLNAEYGCALDLDRVLSTWFGDGGAKQMPWKVTAGTRFGGMTCDGLDGADWGGSEHGFHAPAYPTFLFYNPYPAAKTVQTDFGPHSADLYDIVSHQFIQRNVRGHTSLTLEPETASVLIVTPPGGKFSRADTRVLLEGIAVDYQNGRQ